MVSISFALLHAVIESIIFYLEAKACKSNFLSYAVTCLNGRLNWIPFIEFFNYNYLKTIKVNKNEKLIYDYEEMNFINFCGYKDKIHYIFYNETLNILTFTISNLQK